MSGLSKGRKESIRARKFGVWSALGGFNGLGRGDESFAGQALALKLVDDAAVVDRFGA